ncbi:MAG TPA: macro domain-containing protein [Sedimentisphaerales bacterium]|nr:macro domain-containing protein [Sedimentisphaerales bacterium]
MIGVYIGDIFDSKAQTLVNTVNCVGVMGKGIALEFKTRFPDMYDDYVQRCRDKKVGLGQPYLYKCLTPPWILNFPTKDHWRSISRLEDIVAGLRYLEAHYRQWGITSLAVPPLGCGQGQLEWRVVGPTLYRHLKELDIAVELFAPFGTPHEELKPAFLDDLRESQTACSRTGTSYRIAPAWVALVEILHELENEPYHRPVERTTFQKIAYFATESGVPTGLHYRRGSFGPYAADVKRQVTALVNNGLIHEEQLGRMFAVRVGRTFEDARRAYADQIAPWRETLAKIVDLFMRMDTPQAEIAATVHFAAKEIKHRGKEEANEVDILREVMQWKQHRRPPLNEKEVALTIRNLNMLSWIGAKVSDDLPITEEDVLSV